MDIKMKKSRQGKMNAVDVLILLCVVMLFLIGIYFLFFSDYKILNRVGSGNNEKTVSYTLEISPVDNALLTAEGSIPVISGDRFYHLTDEYHLGTVSWVSEKKPYQTAVDAMSGTLVYVDSPNQSSFTVTVTADVLMNDGVYSVDGHVLRVGDEFTFATPYFTGTCCCISIEEVAK